ncbi:MAG: 2-dehydropantoate 2-reductase [Actinomycetota bacterium]|jgi:2-dehydropantoate 2-reductase|nr:2-dehydropantoate 2-reductase [Actinomycetota bacterium]
MTSIAVVGPGGVGTFFAAHLAAAGYDVLACARRTFDRYVVESDTAPVTAEAKVVTDPADASGPYDVVLVGVKAHQTAGAADWLDAVCGPDSVMVTMQNGVEASTRVAPFVNGAEVLEAVVYCGGELVEPGHTVNSGGGRLILPDVPAAQQVVELFASTPAKVRTNPGHLTEQWRKLGVNVALNGVTALTNKAIPVAGHEPGRSVARALVDECWAVGRAEGADLPAASIEALLDGFHKARGGATSMHQDRLAGRSTEHDALYGAVVRFGERHGIPTPVNAAVGALVAAGD